MHGEGWMGQNRLPKHGDYELEAGPEEYSQCASIIVTECLFHIKHLIHQPVPSGLEAWDKQVSLETGGRGKFSESWL